MTETVKTKKNDFVELEFTGYANGEVFDSNIESELKKINPEAKVKKTLVCIGQGMVVPGLDKALEAKEIGKDYEVDVPWKEGFGERRKDLMRVIPLKSFTEKKVEPRAGMVLALDDAIVKIIAVSGARVTVDFNNPLAGKDLKYKFKIVRKIEDISEKSKAVFELMFKFVPDFEVKDKKVVIKGPKGLEEFVKAFNDKFKEMVGVELGFEEKKEEKKKADITSTK